MHEDYEISEEFVEKSFRSKFIDRIVPDNTSILRKNILIIPNPTPYQTKTCSLDLSDRENIIISTGRLDPIKGYKELIEAFKIVHSELPSWKLKIIGDGNQRAELERLLQVFNLQDAVSLAGLEPKVQRELEKAKVFVSSSWEEGDANVNY